MWDVTGCGGEVYIGHLKNHRQCLLDIFQEWSNAVNDLVAECLIKDFDQRPFMQVSTHFSTSFILLQQHYCSIVGNEH